MAIKRLLKKLFFLRMLKNAKILGTRDLEE